VNEEPGVRSRLWRRLHKALSGVDVDSGQLEQTLRDAALRQSTPVLWLLGTAQSGKTSIVRALTGSSRAEIGNGFQPCTRTSDLYDFPAGAPVVSFLDTRGLGEVHYAADEDIALCESRAHQLIAVIKVTDTRPQEILDVLRAVRRRHPDWPVVIAQTVLHEGYEDGGEHILPYPFDQPGWEGRVPARLRRLLHAQRQHVGSLPGRGAVAWVPIDFTRPGDGFEPVDYGIEALWRAIEESSSLGLRARLRADPAVTDVYSRAAHPHIVGYSMAAGALGALPVVDLALMPVLQARLLQELAGLYRLRWSRRTSSEFLGLLGGGLATAYGLRLAGRSVIKLIPGWGQTLGAVWGASAGAATTFALGKAACAFLEQRRVGHSIEAETLREIYREALVKGRELARVQRDEPDDRGGGADA
jgi:uncharacterized protein (DUF697 family)